MAQLNSPFSPLGSTEPEDDELEKELLYPEQGMQFGVAGNSLFGEQPTDSGIDPTVLAGLGLGGGFVAAGTGGQATTSQVLSPMAQKIAAQDAARLAAQNRPVLIGQPTTTQGVLVGNTPAQSTGTTQARPVSGTQVKPQGQPPALRPSGSPVTTGVTGTRPVKPGLKASDFDYHVGADRKPGAVQKTLSNLSKGLIIGAATTPNIMGDATIEGARSSAEAAGIDFDNLPVSPAFEEEQLRLQRERLSTESDVGSILKSGLSLEEQAALLGFPIEKTPEVSGRTVEDVILAKQARGSDAALTPGEVSEIEGTQAQGQKEGKQLVESAQASQMDIASNIQKLQDTEKLANIEKGLAEFGIERDLVSPFAESAESLEATNAASSFTPRATFTMPDGTIIQEDETGQRRQITSDQLAQFESDMAALGQPSETTLMNSEQTRARLGGRTLNEYLSAPSGTQGVSGLRTDPQGRMIPAITESDADAPNTFAQESDALQARIEAGMQQPGETITQRDTRLAGEKTQSSQNVPQDVIEAMLARNSPRTREQARRQDSRLATWASSSQGQAMGGLAGLERQLEPVDPQKQEYDNMRLLKLGLELERLQKGKPTEYQKAAASVDEAIAAGNISVEDRNKFILRDLGWQAKEGEDVGSFVTEFLSEQGIESGGKPAQKEPSKGSEPTLVKTQEEYDKLAKGTRYVDAEGNIATKK